MSAPAIPYLPPKYAELPLHFLDSVWNGASIKTFGILVALGVYIGSVVAVRHSKQRGQDQDKMNSFIFWVVGIGFIGGHVFDALFYTPERIFGRGVEGQPGFVKADPLYIFKIWAGLSSFGGFLGAIIGAILFKVTKKEKILPFVDTVCSAFPLAWVFGRSGCASVHDHPGRCSDLWIAVKYPPDALAPQICPEGWGRFDLGLIEMVLTIPLAIAFWWLWRKKPRQYGFFAGWMCVAYAPVRFLLDFLRIPEIKDAAGRIVHEADPRYGGLTPAQWACFALVGLGIAIIRMGRSYPPVLATYAEMQEAARRELLEREGEEQDEEEVEAPRKPTPKAKTKTKAKPVVVEDVDATEGEKRDVEGDEADDDAPKADDAAEGEEKAVEEKVAEEKPTDEPPAEEPRRPKKKKKKVGANPKPEEPSSDD
ncbi:MAG: prolipoprotein diacylglyceryl transferase family protein [Polyangiaceae bacterium]